MTRIQTKIRRNIEAISPVIATLLIIAITVVASLVAYAWVTGYLNFTTDRMGQGLQIQSVSVDLSTGNLIVYVQNVGQGIVPLPADSIYVNSELFSLVSANGDTTFPFQLLEGQTVTLIVNRQIIIDEQVKVKVVSSSGSTSEVVCQVSAINPTDKVVYVVVAIDTEMLSPNGHYDYYGTSNPHPVLDMSEYSTTSPMEIAAAFDNNFRSMHQDSYNNPFKITWFAEMDYFFSQGNYVWSDGTSAGVSGYTAVYDLLMNHWGTDIQRYGDTFGYHHHFMTYDTIDNKWRQGTPGDITNYNYDYQNSALDHMIIDEGFYPSTWRTGENGMSPGLSDWLEKWIPFDYTTTVQQGTWYPTHEPNKNRWILSSENPPTQEGVNAAFEQAKNSGAAIYSFWCHDKNDLQSTIDAMHVYLNRAANENLNYKGITFKYVSAQEAMQNVLHLNDRTNPTLTVASNNNEYTITSNEALWTNHPYIALKFADGTYSHIEGTAVGTNTWRFNAPTQTIVNTNVATHAQGSNGLTINAVTASADQGYHLPGEAIDGDDTALSYWDSTPGSLNESPQWLQLDLGSVKTFSTVRTHFYDGDSRSYSYKIDVSTDGSNWQNVEPEKTGTSVMWDDFSPVSARYIRITVTASTASPYAHIIEVNIGGLPVSVSATTSELGHTAELAIDGIDFSYDFWRSTTQPSLSSSPQSLIVDTRTPTTISEIITHFDDAGNTYTYKIDSSTDGSTWTPIVNQKTGSGAVTDQFSQITARYIRITVSDNSGGNFAQITEMIIYHQEINPASQVRMVGVAGSDLSGNTGVKVVNIS
jgi:FlaG/FlaF family flagellin (archaellin)